MKTMLLILCLAVTPLAVHGRDDAARAPSDEAATTESDVVFESEVIFESPVVFLSSVYFYGSVSFAGEVSQPAEERRECIPRSTVFVVGATSGGSYSYANNDAMCANTTAVISIRQSLSGTTVR